MHHDFTIPANEEERLIRLHHYPFLLRSDEAITFDHVAAMAATILRVPVVMIYFVDRSHLIVKGGYGSENITELGNGMHLHTRAVLSRKTIIFEDVRQETGLEDTPLAAGEFGLRFYAAAPICTADHYPIGIISLLDTKTRVFSELERGLLEGLAKAVMHEIEERMLIEKALG